MAGGISIHVVDVSRSKKAAGLKVSLYRLEDAGRVLVAKGQIGADASLDHPCVQGAGVTRGRYEAVFHLADWYRAEGVALPEIPFLERAVYRFGLDDAAQHYHLPLKMTPWGFSLFLTRWLP